MKLFILFRAVVFTALFLFQWSSVITSAEEVHQFKTETYKDIIEKAYNLSLQKDRQQALNLLLNALQKENRPQAVFELKKTISDVAHIFISEKAQQTYESAISVMRSDLNQAQLKLNEALRIEADNMTISEVLARTMIAKGDCSGAIEFINKLGKITSQIDELRIILAQAYSCQSTWPEYFRIFDFADLRKPSLQKFWLILEVERYYKSKNFIKAIEQINLIRKLDNKYPSLFYWSWKISSASKKPIKTDAQKYLLMCKNLTASQFRTYMVDPNLCRFTNEVEADLKGINETLE